MSRLLSCLLAALLVSTASAGTQGNGKASSSRKWEPVIASIKKGDSEQEVMKILSPYHAVRRTIGGDLGVVYIEYKLDEKWKLSCADSGIGQYHWSPGPLISARLFRN